MDILIQILIKAPHHDKRELLAKTLPPLAARLKPEGLSRNLAQSSSLLMRLLEEQTRSASRGADPEAIAKVLAILARRMTPSEGLRVLIQALGNPGTDLILDDMVAVTELMESRAAARLLVLALEQETSVWARKLLSTGLAVVVQRMEPAESAKLLGQAAIQLATALEKETHPFDRASLAEGLGTL